MAIKMIATDLDGTLLTSDHRISSKTKKALQMANKMGIKVVPASGRPLPGVLPYLKQLNISGRNNYAILFNGGVVQRLTGEKLISNDLTYEDLKEILHYQQLGKVNLHFMTENHYYTMDRNLSIIMAAASALNNMKIRVRDLPQIPQDFRFIKAEFSGSASEIKDFREKLPKVFFEKWNASSSGISSLGTDTIEVNNLAASKGLAIHQLAHRLGFHENEVVVFGDQGNDLSMFENNNFYKVAMENAISDLKERADLITKDHDDDGIAYALKKIITSQV
ncbi:Cof-type HAD-IIB family hydrolase [Lactobacillus mulieris]|uniref:Cof-type HAD-IIB family hydrolase n=1 Tax=Lactobacillus mulieris TaxID=2508708 RepID=UPI001F396B1B|nr:Cof-type HAD-IIB family hydrolase [Lactobacillus mulieris]MCF1783577.1 Cof-type HAD-IIB family hydrolase [Lactobacillus mulieris]MCW8104163.1 Cof-type HAD-IIB family hydrolase [Lactobacillus mulieris]MDK6802780.1 Cof-type HAD-IIB family hydrolase [Lactobacillus mulieris]MDK8381896.1 Cof-type HAD-IIB family hydrolase [Lactobacillus mulieris]MDT9620105.1 Cof-type HAD-IIB family hydrolase [Lactobacillus mulieris]